LVYYLKHLTFGVNKNIFTFAMNISYATNKLQKSVSTPMEVKKNYGTRAKQVILRLTQLQGAPTLEAMRQVPQANCHELKGNLKGMLAVDISANFRIIFYPDYDPAPLTEDGGLDWTQVTDIVINAIGEDYH
jgi:plasmid maintenance system killer protein